MQRLSLEMLEKDYVASHNATDGLEPIDALG